MNIHEHMKNVLQSDESKTGFRFASIANVMLKVYLFVYAWAYLTLKCDF